MKVFITKKIPDKGINLLKERGFEVEIGDIKKAGGADALLCLLTDKITGEVMDKIGPQLKVISNYAVGLDNIDLEAAKKRNIVVANTPGVLTEAVVEYTVALILAVSRRIIESDKFLRAGKYKGWEPELFLGTELKGKIFGLVGHGRIGCRVADIMQKAFEMDVIYYDIQKDEDAESKCNIKYVDLTTLLKEADIVSLHVPLLPSTYHLIDEAELNVMKPSAYLINTARGAVVNEEALVKALKEKMIAGAALDVFEKEPKLAKGLNKLENVVLTPHIASATKEARDQMAVLAAQNIISNINA